MTRDPHKGVGAEDRTIDELAAFYGVDDNESEGNEAKGFSAMELREGERKRLKKETSKMNREQKKAKEKADAEERKKREQAIKKSELKEKQQKISFPLQSMTDSMPHPEDEESDEEDIDKYLMKQTNTTTVLTDMDLDEEEETPMGGTASLFFGDDDDEPPKKTAAKQEDSDEEGAYMEEAPKPTRKQPITNPPLPEAKRKRTDHPQTKVNYTVKTDRMVAASSVDTKTDVRFTQSHAASTQRVADTDSLSMYWFDAREDGHGLLGTGGSTAPGTVYLFGKVRNANGEMISCCLRIGGLQRQVFFLPRKTHPDTDEPIPIIDAQREIMRFCSAQQIMKRRVDVRDRWYGFEDEGIPRDCEKWIKLSYSAAYKELGITPTASSNVQKYLSTVTHAFGDGRSFLEMFMLKKRLKGPSWLNVNGFKRVEKSEQMSHCAVEYVVDTYKNIKLAKDWESLPAPPLKALSVSLFTDLRNNVNEIISASAVFYKKLDVDKPSPKEAPYRWAGIRPLPGAKLPTPHVVEAAFKKNNVPPPTQEANEHALLTRLISEIVREDPDVIVGHNFLSFDLDVLLHRMNDLKINTWDRLGRLRLRHMPKLQHGAGGTGDSTWEERSVLGGRVIADSYLLAKEYHKTNSYKLRNLAFELNLGVSEENVTLKPIGDLEGALGQPDGMLEIVTRTDQKALLSYFVVDKLQAIPLTKRLTFLAGNLWTRTLTGSRAERTEYLLLHDFYRQKYVLPDKRRISYVKPDDAEGKRRAKYMGGMVLEPKKGLYSDYVLLLDFNSLYPSIIQEYQICFTTCERPEGDDIPNVPDKSALQCSKCGEGTEPCVHKCVLPKAIRALVNDRRQIKNYIKTEKNPEMRAKYDIIQKALKLTANSIYGCLGFQHSRFYARPLAQLVTQQGRVALSSTVDLVETLPEHQLSVVYGDTDSVMLKTDIPNTMHVSQAVAKARYVKEAVNRRYSNLEIDIDGVFKSILLVRKKKYASTIVKDWQGDGNIIEKEIKGLDMVRRDWCPYTSEVQEKTLDFCLSGNDEETVRSNIIEYLTEVGEVVRSNDAELEKFLITKSLTKDPALYANSTAQPHVIVALRMQENKIPVKVGDFIQYIICTEVNDSGEKKLSSRAFTKDEVVSKKLTIDKEWYLAQQFHPPISRLTESFEGLDSHVIAHCLGVEMSSHIHHIKTTDSVDYSITASGRRAVTERYYPLELRVMCQSCKTTIVFNPHEIILKKLSEWNDAECQPRAGLLRCRSCKAMLNLRCIGNQVVREIRARQKEYFSGLEGYESDYYRDAARKYNERHTRDYVDFVRALFSLNEWCQVVIHYVNTAPEAQVIAICGELTDAPRVAVEKVYALLTDPELEQFMLISRYLKSITEKFAATHVDVGSIFDVVTHFSGRTR
eukprot:TRINITY_DN3503_c1_g1_i1.p1 TRINITY_DN3503_c1_g1~~TRINITY_DN3503_c1_g1_i1.p1  ORF type:complete len:1420 (+),score=393.38 TRINITY_DN3503_c1_g1_i1:80-4261(+)